LQKFQYEVAPLKTLSKKETSCRDQRCMAELAERHNVDLVLTGEVRSDDQAPPTYHVRVLLLDRAKPMALREEKDVCASCTEQQASERLYQAALKALSPP